MADTSRYEFEIDADPAEITLAWITYWYSTKKQSSLTTMNCANATQWFLEKYVQIPKLNCLAPLSIDHIFLGVPWISFLPFPVTLPGRVMAHAKFHLEIRKHPEWSQEDLNLVLSIGLTVLSLTLFVAVLAVFLETFTSADEAAPQLNTAITQLSLRHKVGLGLTSAITFFNAYNASASRIIARTQEPAINSHCTINS